MWMMRFRLALANGRTRAQRTAVYQWSGDLPSWSCNWGVAPAKAIQCV
jgi:hypothetical protein